MTKFDALLDWAGTHLLTILAIVGAAFVLKLILMTLFSLIRWRRRQPLDRGKPLPRENWLSAFVALVSLILIVLLYLGGMRPFLDSQVAPVEAVAISASASDSLGWLFTYGNGYESAQLHLPLERPALLHLSSEERVKRLSIPELGVRRDAVPGHPTRLWIQPPAAGAYGPEGVVDVPDSLPSNLVVVHEAGDFAPWLVAAMDPLATMPPVEAGAVFVARLNCAQCHSTDGGRLVGPSFKDIYGRDRVFTDGSRLTSDRAYLVESILQPKKKVVEGFEAVMPEFSDRLGEREANAIVDYLLTLSEKQEVSE